MVTIRTSLAGDIITFLIIGDGAPRRVSSGVRFNPQSAEATVRQAIAAASRQQTSDAARAAFNALSPSSIAAQLRGAARPAAPAQPVLPAAPTPQPRAQPQPVPERPARPADVVPTPARPPRARPQPAPEPRGGREEEGERRRRPEVQPTPEPEPEPAAPRAETTEITRQLVLLYLQSAADPTRAGGAVNLIIQNSAGIERLLGRASERRQIFVEVFNAIYRRPWGEREYSRLFAHINRLASEQGGAFNDLLAAVQEGNGLSVGAVGASRSGTALERAAVQALALFFVAQGDERRDGEFNGQAFSEESGRISTGLLGSLRGRQPAALDAELLALSALYLRRDITRDAPQWERAIAGTEAGRARETPESEPAPRPRPGVREEERAPAAEERAEPVAPRPRPAARREVQRLPEDAEGWAIYDQELARDAAAGRVFRHFRDRQEQDRRRHDEERATAPEEPAATDTAVVVPARAEGPRRAIFFGDSLTASLRGRSAAGFEANFRDFSASRPFVTVAREDVFGFPSASAQDLSRMLIGHRFSEEEISGVREGRQEILRRLNEGRERLEDRVAAMRRAGTPYTDVYIEMGVNDISISRERGMGDQAFQRRIEGLALRIIGDLRAAYHYARDALHLNVIAVTIPPAWGYGGWGEPQERVRELVNRWIRGETLTIAGTEVRPPDAVSARVDLDPHFMAEPRSGEYGEGRAVRGQYTRDGIHYNDEGVRLMARQYAEQGYRAREERARPAERREERREEPAAERREEARPPRRRGQDAEAAPGILLR